MEDDGVMLALGRAVRRRRRALHLTQKDCAQRAGVHPETIRNVELGRVRSSYKLALIASALGTTVQDLFDEADATGGARYPGMARLVRELMTKRGMTNEDLARDMGCDLDDIERLVRGDAGPLYWGAAAVAFGLPVRVLEIAALEGYDTARRVLERPRRRTRRR